MTQDLDHGPKQNRNPDAGDEASLSVVQHRTSKFNNSLNDFLLPLHLF